MTLRGERQVATRDLRMTIEFSRPVHWEHLAALALTLRSRSWNAGGRRAALNLPALVRMPGFPGAGAREASGQQPVMAGQDAGGGGAGQVQGRAGAGQDVEVDRSHPATGAGRRSDARREARPPLAGRQASVAPGSCTSEGASAQRSEERLSVTLRVPVDPDPLPDLLSLLRRLYALLRPSGIVVETVREGQGEGVWAHVTGPARADGAQAVALLRSPTAYIVEVLEDGGILVVESPLAGAGAG